MSYPGLGAPARAGQSVAAYAAWLEEMDGLDGVLAKGRRADARPRGGQEGGIMKAILLAARRLLDMGKKSVTISTVRVLFGSLPGTDFQVRIGAAGSNTEACWTGC